MSWIHLKTPSKSFTVYMFTNRFPYKPGEEFIDAEIDRYVQSNAFRLVVCPIAGSEVRWRAPASVRISNIYRRSIRLTKFGRAIYMLIFLFNRFFWREIFMEAEPRHKWISLWELLKNGGTTIAIARSSRHHLSAAPRNDKRILYSYWYDTAAYGIALARGLTGCTFPHVVRAHGYDVYRERRPGRYMPLKRQLRNEFEHLCTISDSARDYLIKEYEINPQSVKVFRLGTQSHKLISPSSLKGSTSLVSCSSCVPVKRLDRMLKVVTLYAKTFPDRMVNWTHIGDGLIRSMIEASAARTTREIANLTVDFTGYLPHDEVFNFYRSNPVDVFLNTSDSEGAPVAIMEAISFGIPVVAPAVGGIVEMLGQECGRVLNPKADISDYVASINEMSLSSRVFRQQIKIWWTNRFHGKKNYSLFEEYLRGIYRANDLPEQ